MPVEVYRHDGLGPRADPCRCRRRVEVQRFGIHVGENRRCAYVDQHVRRSREGERGRDHLVSRPDPQTDESQMQSCSTRADR
jgi:hypothetical protein